MTRTNRENREREAIAAYARAIDHLAAGFAERFPAEPDPRAAVRWVISTYETLEPEPYRAIVRGLVYGA